MSSEHCSGKFRSKSICSLVSSSLITEATPFIFLQIAVWAVKFLFMGNTTCPGLGGMHRVSMDWSSTVMLTTSNCALSQLTRSPLKVCL